MLKKKFALIPRTGSIKVFDFSDLLDFEVNEDGKNLLEGKFFDTGVGALTGNILGGGIGMVTGALLGSSGSRDVKNICNNFSVYINLNNLQTTSFKVPFNDGKDIDKKSSQYSYLIDEVNELISLLKYIKNNA